MRTIRFQAFLISVVLLLSCNVGLSATYHVSNQGADKNDGLTPQTAWATLDRVNVGPFKPGDKILFQRDGVWRGSLIPHSGSGQGRIIYAAYGKGAKPLLLGSVSKSKITDWTDEGNGLWSSGEMASDVGNIIFGNEEVCGVKVWREADLKQDGDYWFDRNRRLVKLRMSENPAKRYARIECALRGYIIQQSNRSYVRYENLMLKYGGSHGIGGGNTHHIIVRECDIGFIGGSDQYGDGRTVRLGNGIEFWVAAHDNLVERCRLWEIYDAALTNQGNSPRTSQYNIVYRNNVIWNSEYSFEYWNRPEDSETHDIYFINNTCVNAGFGWGHTQRPDPSGRHLCFYKSPARANNIIICNNIFDGAKGPAFYAPTWSKAQVDGLTIDNNCWRQDEGIMIHIANSAYTMADFAKYQAEWNKEPHSFCAAARFLDRAAFDFRLAPDSPCIGSGSNRPYGPYLDGLIPPQGKTPDMGAILFSTK